MLKVYAEGIDGTRAASAIQAAAEERANGARLTLEQLATGKMRDPQSFESTGAFLEHFLLAMQDTAFVDISDFEIVERRQRWARPLVCFKKAVWSLLRFYTYRLWSQQNEVNGFMLAALQGLHESAKEKAAELEGRVAELEKQLAEAASHPHE